MDSIYKASDFKDARYNVLAIGIEKVIEAFPELKRYPEFHTDFKKEIGLDSDKVIRYVILMYMDNVLSRTITDLTKRKRESAFLAGFELQKDNRRFPETLESIMECNLLKVNELIIRVIRLNNDSDVEQLAVYEEAKARQMYKLLTDQSDNEKTKEVHENIRRLSDDIIRLRRKVLSGEKSKNLIHSLYHEIDFIHLGIRPEEIAEAKRQGAIDAVLYDVYAQEVDVSEIPDTRPGSTRKKRGRKKKDEQV